MLNFIYIPESDELFYLLDKSERNILCKVFGLCLPPDFWREIEKRSFGKMLNIKVYKFFEKSLWKNEKPTF